MSDAFLKKLGSVELCGSDAEETTVTEVTNCKPCLYKVNGPRILYDMPLVAGQPLKQKYLTSQDSFLLVIGPTCPLYIWIGNSADVDVMYDALQFAVNFKQHYNHPMYTAICRVREGNEPVGFIKAFIDWKNRIKKHGSAVNNYPITNIDRSTHRIDDSSPRETFQGKIRGNDKTEIWQVSGETLVNVPAQHHGVLYNHRCYIIFNKASKLEDQLVIYLWVGSKTSINEQAQVMKMAVTMNSLMEHKATIIRVFDGTEQHHFIRIMQGAIIVYDVCLVRDNIVADKGSIDNNTEFFNSTIMFRVQKLEPDCVRMSQVSPLSTSLNSAAVFLIFTRDTSMLWYGKKSSAQERECSKYMFTYVCPERLHDYDIIIEGREPATFWSLVEHNGDYPKQLSEFKLPRHFPTLVLCSRKVAMWSFTDIPDFSQEDLCETDIFILDTHDQIQLWIGSCFLGGDDQETLSNIIQAYIRLDPAGRHDSDLHVLFCHQGFEPSLFRKYFRRWNCHEYGQGSCKRPIRKSICTVNRNTQCCYLNTKPQYTAKLFHSPGSCLLMNSDKKALKPSDITEMEYEALVEETLDSLTEYFEDLPDSQTCNEDYDCTYGNGVLTLQIGSKAGTYVINKQSPNKQIWLSSPVSGPKRYDYVCGQWVYLRDGKGLHNLLEEEISQLVGFKINLKKCKYYSDGTSERK